MCVLTPSLKPPRKSAFSISPVEDVEAADEGGAAAGHDALLDGRPRGAERVVHAVLLLVHLNLGRAADLQHGNTWWGREIRFTKEYTGFRLFGQRFCQPNLPI